MFAAFVVWRAIVTLAVWPAPEHCWEGLTSSRAERLARALPPSPWDPLQRVERLQMLRDHTSLDAQIYVLVDPLGAKGAADLLSAARFSRLLYPRFVQAITSLPLPASAAQPPRAGQPIWLLDLRAEPDAERPGFVLVERAHAAALWRAAP